MGKGTHLLSRVTDAENFHQLVSHAFAGGLRPLDAVHPAQETLGHSRGLGELDAVVFVDEIGDGRVLAQDEAVGFEFVPMARDDGAVRRPALRVQAG